jgi:putative MATE family efflux protein
MKIRQDVLKLAIPVFTEQLFITTIGILNTVIASGIGKEAISAIGTVDSFNNIIIFFFNSLAVGGTVVVAQYMGQKNAHGANEAAKQAIFSSIVISIFLTLITWLFRDAILLSFIGRAEKAVVDNAVEYFRITLFNYPLTAFSFVASGILRSSGHQNRTMKINIAINVANIVLSYTLIYGISLQNVHTGFSIPAMGVKGAAVAITLARLFGMVLFLIALVKSSHILDLKMLKSFRIDFRMQKTILNIGLPAGLETFFFNIGKFVQQIFIISLGTVSIAANTISWSIFGLLFIPGSALSIVAMTMVGYFMGREEYQEAKKVNFYLVKLAMACNLVLCLFVFPFATVISSIYSQDAEVIRLTAEIVRMNAVAVPILWPAGFIVPSSLRGAGDSKFTMVVSVASLWVFRVMLGYLFSITLHFGIVGLWGAMYFDWVARAVIYHFRLQGGKWMRKVV